MVSRVLTSIYFFFRWEILSEIIQAQNLRLSRPPPQDNFVPQEYSVSMQQPLEEAAETPRTRRKLATSTKRIQFETSYAKVIPVLNKIGKIHFYLKSKFVLSKDILCSSEQCLLTLRGLANRRHFTDEYECYSHYVDPFTMIE